MKHEQCNDCRVAGRDCSQEPCCRCENEAERQARLLDDPVLAVVHGTIMSLANSWRQTPAMAWERGRVCGAIAVFHRLALEQGHDWRLADAASWEYHAMVGIMI